MEMDSHCLNFTRKMGRFKGLMWVGEMWLNKQKEVENGGWSSRTVCKYQSTEEKQQLCVRFVKVMVAPKGTICVSRWASTRNHHLAKSSFWHAGCHIHVCLYQGSVTREAGLISAETHTRCLSGHSSSELFMICLCVMTLRLLVTWLVFHDNHFPVPSLLTSICLGHQDLPSTTVKNIRPWDVELSQKTKTDGWKSVFEE